MKNVKKIFLSVIVILCAFLLTGCGNVKGKLPDLMEKLYDGIPQENRPMMLDNIEITEENAEYYLGTKGIEYEEALASESGIGSTAHSVVLLRAKAGADIENIKDQIEKNIDPNKWICVGVEKEDVIVENKGDLVILILVDDEENREKIEDNFEKLK